MNSTHFPRSLTGVIFAILVILLALGNSWPGLYPFGSAVYIRPMLGFIGIAGAICLLAGNPWWRLLLPIWCSFQSVVIATDVSGEWFDQGLKLGFSGVNSQSVRMNNFLTSYSAWGWSTTGLMLLLILFVIACFRLHPTVRRKLSFRPINTLVFSLPLLAIVGSFAYRHASQSSATYVLDLDLPNVPIYYKDQFLGRTPLVITPAKIAEWKLPLNTSQHFLLSQGGWCDCAELRDDESVLRLCAGTPWPFADYVERFDSPWGERVRMNVGGEQGNRRTGYVLAKPSLRGEPILTIQMRDAQPIQAGGPLRLHCVLNNTTQTNYVGRSASLERHCFAYDKEAADYKPLPASVRRTIDMPDTWKTLPAGATQTADLEFDAPSSPGDHELFCTWFLYSPQAGSNTGAGSVYSNIIWLRTK